MDYKPNLCHSERFAEQLMAYKQALHKRTQIPEENISIAVFNQYNYFEYD
ncbi:MAG: hypothetical protein KGY65_08855 [Candidatus Thermoplasmatota archaeon]|nr:hypothetical protein [Candidatus Thermoplasmatota archaeon]